MLEPEIHHNLTNTPEAHELHFPGARVADETAMNDLIDNAEESDLCYRLDIKQYFVFYNSIFNPLVGTAGSVNIRLVSVDTVLDSTDDTVLVDTTAADVIITLPTASDSGHVVTIINIGATGNMVTVNPAGGDSLAGGSVSLRWNTATIQVQSNGTTAWWIIFKSNDNISSVSDNTSSGVYAHTEGRLCVASNTAAHAEGQETIASGNRSHAEGYQTSASGDQSHAGGNGSTSAGETSFAHGKEAHANNPGSLVLCDNNGGGVSSTNDNEATLSYSSGLRLLTGQTPVAGDSGVATYEQPLRGSTKKFIVYLDAFVDVAGVTINFPTAFTYTPFISGNTSVLAIAVVSSTQVTLTTVAPVTGYLILEGF